MKNLKYYLDRRKIIFRVTKNWLARTLHEPFRSKGNPEKSVIIFVRQNARSRIFNHGDILRRDDGIRTILLTKFFDYKFQRQAFDEIYTFLNKANLQKKVKQLAERYNLIAVVGSTQPAGVTRVLIDMPRNWPVLVDQLDSYWAASYFASKTDNTIPQKFVKLKAEIAEEQYIFRRADGVIMRSGELLVLFKEQGIDTPYVFIEDGCNPRYFQPLKQYNSHKDEDWSIAYAGIFHPMSFDSRSYGDTQFVPFGKIFSQEKIHFHLYPSPHHNYQYPEYHAEASRNPYFHIHPSVDFGKIHSEISKYDFGWFALDASKCFADSEVLRQHAISAKLFTYFEAGLPVITNNDHARRAQIVDQTGAGFIVSSHVPKGIRAAIEQQDMNALIQGVAQARMELDVNSRSEELLTFIKDIRKRWDLAQK